ncbi:unnamed protein product [Closterium sp. Naga37s-1]|nr:unnamed protein product [Closterium sp. Naga37s-1]
MASSSVFAAVLLLSLSIPFVLAGNAAGAEQSSQSNYEYDANGNIILSSAGNNNQNGNGKGTSADVIDWYNDQEYPTCPLKACPPFKHYCSGGMCNDTAGILGRWRLPEQSSLVCPPGRANPKPNNEWCIGELTPSQCCKACSDSKEPCAMWQHYIGTVNPSGKCLKCGICWLYPPGTAPRCETQLDNNNGYRIKYNCSRIGGSCPYTKNDPHFQGAQGTRFEFNGAPEKTFCLLTDRNVHVNMQMRGYYDTRTVGATVLRNGKAVRTWIRALGFVWRAAAGEAEHKFRLVARTGKKQERGDGFLELAEIDGKALPRMTKERETLSLPGGLAFTYVGVEFGGFVKDVYRVTIAGLLDMEIKLRVAHPLLQTPDDAEAHINVAFDGVEATEQVHGIIGQTYREGREKRAMDYNTLAHALGHPIAADAAEGAGFLDGKTGDYESSSVLAADCRFSAFSGKALPLTESTSPSTESASFPPQSPSAPAPPVFPLFSSPLPAVLPPPPALPHLLPRQQQRLALYLDLRLDWNQVIFQVVFQRMNLTAVTSRAEAEQRHIADSLTLIPVILALTAPPLSTVPLAAALLPTAPHPTTPLPTEPLATASIPTEPLPAVPLSTAPPASEPLLDPPSVAPSPAVPHGTLRLVDVGTGAGLPGVVLAVAQPTWHVTLVESLNKRCDFLSHVVQRLGLNNVQVVCGRAEEVGRDPVHRGAYDLAVARAVAEMRVLNELCLPLVRVGGAFIAAKGPNPQDEVAAASNSASLLSAQLVRIYEVASSNSNGQRTAVIYKKVEPTASKYPRRPGMPSKRPL